MKLTADMMIDFLEECKDRQEAKERIIAISFLKKKPTEVENYALRKIRSAFEENLDFMMQKAAKDNMTEPIWLDLVCRSSVSVTILSLKSTRFFQYITGLDDDEYEMLLIKTAKEVVDKYLNK